MDIQNDLLRKALSEPFGWNLSGQSLLEGHSSSNVAEAKGQSLTTVDKELSERAARRLVAEEVNKQKNMEEVVKRADEILQANPIESSSMEESDLGWVEDCLDGAGKAFDDGLKGYWAKLLAGEIKTPGTYSKRIINFMKMVSRKDAERIRRICPYVMYDFKGRASIFRYNDSKINYAEISFLSEMQLLDPSSFLVKQYRFESGRGNAFLMKKDLGFLLKIENKEYDLPVYAFTELGNEVMSIIDDSDADFDYLKRFAVSITKNTKILAVNCGNFTSIDDRVVFDNNENYFEIPEGSNHLVKTPK